MAIMEVDFTCTQIPAAYVHYAERGQHHLHMDELKGMAKFLFSYFGALKV